MIADLEVWLVGPPHAIDAAARALAGIGQVRSHADRQVLAGEDTGRERTYARISVPTATPTVAAVPDPAGVNPAWVDDAEDGAW